MNIGKLFLSLGIKSDTKSLDEAIRKVEQLKKQTQELNKALKETKANSKIGITSTSSGAAKSPKESQALREEAAIGAAKLRIAKTELGFANLEEQTKKKQDKEQKKREKDREKATKDFFNQVENGFSFIAKAFTGGLLAGGLGGYIVSQTSQQAALSASLRQYGIDPETSQRYANVFRRSSGGQLGVKETNAFIANIERSIGNAEFFDPGYFEKFQAAGVDPTKIKDFDSFIKEVRQASKDPRYQERNLTALLDKLGVPGEFAPAFGKNFSDQEFSDAYNNARILTNEQVNSAREVNLALADLANNLNVLSGTLIDKFAPAIVGIASKINENLTPENAETAADVAKGLGAGYLFTKGAKTIAKYGRAGLGRLGVVGAGGAALYKGLSYLADRNEELLYGNRNKKDEEYVADFGGEPADRLKMNPNMVYSQQEIAEAIRATSVAPNVTTNVNINAGSVDKDTAPFIANEINANVNRSLYNSRYSTISVPK